MKKFVIGIIDDQYLFAEGLRELVLTFDFIASADIYEIPSINGFKAPRQHLDLVLLDILMPHMNGFEVFNSIKKNSPEQKVAFLSVQQDLLSLSKAKKTNVNGYLFKNNKKEQLKDALKKILIENKNHFDESLINEDTKFKISSGKQVKITLRELEFLELFLQELTSQEIAHEMALSTHTVIGYRKTLFEKFEVNNMIGLAKYAIDILKNYYH